MPSENITELLHDAADGDERAADRLMPLVYDHLRDVADGLMARSGRNQTLQPTALVNEAYVKLVRVQDENWAGRTHFFAVAATAMRQILIDKSRRRGAIKRGGDRERITLDAAPGDEPPEHADMLDLGRALEQLHENDPRAARVVELRFFAGMTEPEIAEVIGVSERTVRNDWRHARAWLRQTLSDETSAGDNPS